MNFILACTGLEGPLSASHRDVLRNLFRQPSPQLWEQAKEIVISPAPFLTVEAAVNNVSQKGIAASPDSFTLYRALRYAVIERENYLREPFPQTRHAFESF